MQSGGKPITFAVDARLDQSIDQGAGADPGTLSELVNLRKHKHGGMRKRRGYTSTTSPGIASTVRAIPRGNSIAVVDGVGSIYAYGEGVDKWKQKDYAPRWALTGAAVVAQHPKDALNYGGCCSGSGATVHVYADTVDKSIKSVTIDEASGAVLRGPEQLAIINGGVGETTMPIARITTDGSGTLWVLILHDGTGSSQRLDVIATTFSNIIGGGAWPARTNIVADVDTSDPGFDLSVNTSLAVVAYNSISAGVHRIKIITLNTSGTIVDTYTNNTPCRAVSCYSKPGLSWIWVHYALTGAPATTEVRVFSTNLTFKASSAGADQTVGSVATTAIGEYSANAVMLASSSDTHSNVPFGALAYVIDTFNGVATLTPGSVLTAYGCNLASQPFYDGSDVYVWVDINTSLRSDTSTELVALTHNGGTIYTVTTSFTAALFPHMRVAAGRTSGGLYTSGYLAPQKPYVSSADSSTWVWDGGFAVGPIFPASIKEYRVQRATAATNAAMVPLEAQGTALCTGGAQGFIFDGEHFTELGFCYLPVDVDSYATTSGAGGSIGAGSYQYAVTYEYTDAAGNRHQSGASFSSVVTLSGATSKVTFALPSLRITTKQDREFSDSACQIVVWRTLSTDAIQYHRVGSVTNNPEVATVTFADTFADSTVDDGEILYIARGELANEMPPPMWHAAILGGKVAAIDAEYRNRIVFSKPLQLERGPEFSSANETFVNGIGPLTALAEMDGTLYAFSSTAIAAAAWGDGIDAAGQGSWPQAETISRAAGCIDPRAICNTQDGIIFVSRTSALLSIWLLPRGGGNPIEIGQRVRKYLDRESYLTVLGYGVSTLTPTACLNWPDQGRVVIHFRGSDGTSFSLEYDYIHKGQDGIGVWNACFGATFDASGGATSAVVANGEHWIAAKTSSAIVVKSSATSYADDSSWVPWHLRTHDLRPGSLSPVGKVNAVDVELETQADNGGVVSIITEDSFFTENAAPGSEPYKATFAFTGVSAGARVHRYWQPSMRRLSKGKGFALHLYSAAPGGSKDSADVVPRTVSIDYVGERGTFRPAAGERV